MEKLHYSNLNSSSIYKIQILSKKFNIDYNYLEDLIVELLSNEFTNNLERIHTESYNEGYEDAREKFENQVPYGYINESEHDEEIRNLEKEILTLNKENEQILNEKYILGYRTGFCDGYKLGIEWKEPPKDFPELKNIYNDS